MEVVAAIVNVLAIVLIAWDFIKPIAKKALGFGTPATAGGAVGAKAAVETAGALSKFPHWFVSLFEKGGKLYGFRRVFSLLRHGVRAPIIFAITALISAFCPTIFEKLFLVVGAVFAKLGLMFLKWSTSMISGMDENNTEELFSILGDSASNLPPCMIDILGYLHMIEDLGMIISTLIFIGLYNLIKHFYFRFI